MLVEDPRKKKHSDSLFSHNQVCEITGIMLYVIFPFNIIPDILSLLIKGDLYTFSRNIVSCAVVSTHLTDEAYQGANVT